MARAVPLSMARLLLLPRPSGSSPEPTCEPAATDPGPDAPDVSDDDAGDDDDEWAFAEVPTVITTIRAVEQDHRDRSAAPAGSGEAPGEEVAGVMEEPGVSPDFSDLFAEPPPAPAAAPRTQRDPRARRRKLLLLAATMAGGWLTLGPQTGAGNAPPRSAVTRVEPAPAAPAHAHLIPIDAHRTIAEPVSPARAAAELAAHRYGEALPLYRRLAAERPDEPVHQVIVEVLIRELDDRCRSERSGLCEPR
jgi:hypothetical protein